MSSERCHNCGGTEIEEDNARGDRGKWKEHSNPHYFPLSTVNNYRNYVTFFHNFAVCTNCGSVLDDSVIVSEVQYEEVGSANVAMGHFVATGATGAPTSYGFGKFHVSSGVESREVTVRKAKKEITILCQQLQLGPHFSDTAVNFFRMALMRHLTRGRRSTHVYAACVYMACRLEGTSRRFIVLQIISFIFI